MTKGDYYEYVNDDNLMMLLQYVGRTISKGVYFEIFKMFNGECTLFYSSEVKPPRFVLREDLRSCSTKK